MLKLKLQYFGHLMWTADALEKTLKLGNIEGRRRRGRTEDEMVGWHHWLNGHEFEQALGVGDGQGGLACCSPWGCKGLYMTEWLNWAELTKIYQLKFVCISACTHSVTALCLTLCNPMDCSMPGFPVFHYLPVCSNSCSLSWWYYLILCHPLLLLPSIFPSLRIFSNESAVCIR